MKNVGSRKSHVRLLSIHKHVNQPVIKKQIKILNEPYQKKGEVVQLIIEE